MAMSRGRTLALSAARRFIGDLMHASHKVPQVPMERSMPLAPLVAARKAAPVRIGWCTILTRAFALLATQYPELRRAYLAFPRPRLYEHPHSVAAVAVERRFDGERCVFFAHLPSPETTPLPALEAHLRHFKEFPVPGIQSFCRALQVSRWPLPARRLVWWAGLNLSGPLRSSYIGTFAVTSTAGLGASALFIPSPLTATLHYGLLDRDGRLPVRLAFDHRVLDGAMAARLLTRLEKLLLERMVVEVQRSVAVAASAA